MDFERAYTLRIIINNLINKLTNARSAILESRWAVIGSFFIFFGIILFIVQFISPHFFSLRFETGLVGLSLGLLSVGVAIYAIHLSKKTDRKHTELLKILDKKLTDLPIVLGVDTLSPSIREPKKEILREEILSEEILRVKARIDELISILSMPQEPSQILKKGRISDLSKIAAQRRVDEDKKRVGYVRGEIYQIEDGKWGVNWGGKYRL